MLHIGWDNLEEGFLQMHKVTSALCLLLSQVFIPVLFPPQAAHGDEPNQVRSLTSSNSTGASGRCRWNKNVPYALFLLLSQVIFPACIPHCGRQEKS